MLDSAQSSAMKFLVPVTGSKRQRSLSVDQDSAYNCSEEESKLLAPLSKRPRIDPTETEDTVSHGGESMTLGFLAPLLPSTGIQAKLVAR